MTIGCRYTFLHSLVMVYSETFYNKFYLVSFDLHKHIKRCRQDQVVHLLLNTICIVNKFNENTELTVYLLYTQIYLYPEYACSGYAYVSKQTLHTLTFYVMYKLYKTC